MDQLPETLPSEYPAQRIPAGTKPIRHNAVMSAHHAGEKTKTQDALTVIVLQALVIDQRDLPLQNGAKHLLIARLHLFSMGKEKIGLPGQQLVHRHFLDAKQKIAFAKLVA